MIQFHLMKNVLVFLVLLFSIFLPSYAVEEVILDVDDNNEPDFSILNIFNQEDENGLTLYEKLQNIKAREIKDTNSSAYLFDSILTKKFETGPIDTAHFFAYYRAALDMDVDNGDGVYDFNAIQAGVNGKFRGGKNFYEARFRFNPLDGHSYLHSLPIDIYVANTSIPHHRIIIGNTRTSTGYEGSRSDSIIPMIARAQISRNFGNIRKLGVKVRGSYSLVDYDFGGYSSDTYFHNFFPGAEFAGWINIKPLGKTNGKYGKLVFGSGLTAGQNDTNYCVTGAYAGYEYKKFMANFEWAAANGYNGARGISTKHAEGFYTTIGYKITPMLQILARYDQYKPDKRIPNDSKEYTIGLNYFIKGQALKMMLNYVFCQNHMNKDSHRIILGTQILL